MHTTELQPIHRLSRDLAKAAAQLSDDEARYLVDFYYISQRDRIRAANQLRALSETAEPCSVLGWLSEQAGTLEAQIKCALQRYSTAHQVGEWSLSVDGIGPIIAAGLLAHIDIQHAPTVGHIWRYAGLDPTSKWNKGEKRPWNASLKTLCWKIGESFVKVKGKQTAVYGHYYAERKQYRQQKNDRGDYRDRALAIIAARPTHAQAATYKQGRLPDGHVHAQAKRDAVKLFLAHWHAVAYESKFNRPPPLPYAIGILGHAHLIDVPR